MSKVLGDVGLAIVEPKNYEWVQFDGRVHELANNWGGGTITESTPGSLLLLCGFGKPYELIRLRHQVCKCALVLKTCFIGIENLHDQTPKTSKPNPTSTSKL